MKDLKGFFGGYRKEAYEEVGDRESKLISFAQLLQKWLDGKVSDKTFTKAFEALVP